MHTHIHVNKYIKISHRLVLEIILHLHPHDQLQHKGTHTNYCICMYVCMYVYVYVYDQLQHKGTHTNYCICMYACMYVCMCTTSYSIKTHIQIIRIYMDDELTVRHVYIHPSDVSVQSVQHIGIACFFVIACKIRVALRRLNVSVNVCMCVCILICVSSCRYSYFVITCNIRVA
jgi:hypothetical protein